MPRPRKRAAVVPIRGFTIANVLRAQGRCECGCGRDANYVVTRADARPDGHWYGLVNARISNEHDNGPSINIVEQDKEIAKRVRANREARYAPAKQYTVAEVDALFARCIPPGE